MDGALVFNAAPV